MLCVCWLDMDFSGKNVAVKGLTEFCGAAASHLTVFLPVNNNYTVIVVPHNLQHLNKLEHGEKWDFHHYTTTACRYQHVPVTELGL